MQALPPESLVRRRLLFALLLVVPLGFVCKYGLPSPLQTWGNQYGAALLYEVFWVLLVALIWPSMSPMACAGWVFAVTCALEATQWLDLAWLERLQSTTLGSWLLGTTFDPLDFAYYVVGCGVGWSILVGLYRRRATQD